MIKQSSNTEVIISSTSSVDFPQLMAINLGPKNESIKVITIKEEPLAYTGDEIKTITSTPGQINIDDNIEGNQRQLEEFISIKQETENNENFKIVDVSEEYFSIKQETEFMENNDNFQIEGFNEENGDNGLNAQLEVEKSCDKLVTIAYNKEQKLRFQNKCGKTYVGKHAKKDIKIIEIDAPLKSSHKSQLDVDGDTDLELKHFNVSNNIQMEVESNDTYYSEIKIETSPDLSLNLIGNRDNTMPNIPLDVKYDENEQVNCREYPTKCEDIKTGEYDIMQEPLSDEEFDHDDEVVMVLQIVADDDDTDIKIKEELTENHDILLKTPINPSILEQRNKNIKRIRNEIEHDLPSTSQPTILNCYPNSSKLTKKLCLSYRELQDHTNLCINSKVEAFDCLHSIKRYLQSRHDELGITLITDIMKSFMLCGDTYQQKSS